MRQERGIAVSGMSVSGVSPYSQSVPAQGAAPVQEEQKALADALKAGRGPENSGRDDAGGTGEG